MSCHLFDLINMQVLKQVMDSFYAFTGISAAIVDLDHNYLLGTGQPELFMELPQIFQHDMDICVSPESQYIQDSGELYSFLAGNPDNLLYYCKPVIIENMLLGILVITQAQYQISEEASGRNTNISIRGSIEEAIIFLSQLVELLASMGLERISQIEIKRSLELEQNTRAQRLISLSVLSAGVVHEIAQPLNTIKLAADGILYRYHKGYSLSLSNAINKLQEISIEVSRINEIIHHIPSFANIGQHSELVACDINHVVNAVLKLLGRQISAHGIKLKTHLAEQLPRVVGDNTRLQEVVINLLINAMHALDRVNHSNKEIVCLTRCDSKTVILEVRDNATGINAEMKDEIFEPFFSTRGAGEGMGLGLSIVQSIVTSFNGRVETYNNASGGATFWVEWPAYDVDEKIIDSTAETGYTPLI